MKKNGFCVALGLILVGGTVAFGQTPPRPVVDDGSTSPGNYTVAPVFGEPIALSRCANQTGSLWLSAEYLLWWVRGAPTGGPLVTTTEAFDPATNFGALGQSSTRILFGDQPINYGALSGLRIGGGTELNELIGLQGSYFFLARRTAQSTFASDANGNPLIARPVFNNQTGMQDVYATSNPGLWAGNTNITSSIALQGFDFNLAVNLLYFERSRLDFLVGFRALYLTEDLTIQDNVTPLAAGILGFLNGPADPPSTITDFDRFRTSNHFYGGQLGLHWQGARGPFAVDVTGKLALGTNQQTVTIDGATTLNAPGAAPQTAPGGILAQVTNMGRHYQSAFSAVPEIGLNLSYQVTPRLKAMVGYTFLYWTNVVRPGNQIDHNINPALPPGDQDFGNGLGQNRPAFNFHSTDFWAQGLNFGLEFRF